MPRWTLSLSLAVLALVPLSALCQSNDIVGNWKNYERFSAASLRPYVYSSSVTPRFLKDADRFWYVWRESSGKRFMFVDPAKRQKNPLFDHEKLAAQLSQLHKKAYEPTALPFDTVDMSDDGSKFKFDLEEKRYEYDIRSETLKFLEKITPPKRPATEYKRHSPDKKAFVYVQAHNLYFVEGEEDKDALKISNDGERFYSFGGGGFFEQREDVTQESQTRKTEPNATWSPDSKAFFISRFDSRKVKELFLVNNLAEPRPTLQAYRYSMPGEAEVTQSELWIFLRGTKTFRKVKVDKWKDQTISEVHWPETSDRLRFVRRDRLQRNLELCEYDVNTEAIKVLLAESTEFGFLERQPVRYIKPGGDFLWYSERTGWGHYYRYAHDGTLKNAVTSGLWRAESLTDVDGDKGLVFIKAVGREPGENLYYTHDYRVRLDGSDLKLLNPGDANHSAAFGKTKNFLVDSCSRVDMPTRSCVYDDNGKELMVLEEMDLTRLKDMGWKMPETFTVKADDGFTDIYGNMWKPFDFDPKKKYPIILNVYPGPQTESVSASFSATSSNQQLAQVGFIVIQIGNRGGSPQRSNAYHSYGYFNLRDYGLADKKAGVEQLAAKYPWIDIDRVGIYGHSGGGYMTAAALLLPPYNEFFKVGVSSSGNHDNNVYNQNWSEQHHGLKEVATKTPELEDMYGPLDAMVLRDLEEMQQRRGQGGGQGGGQGQQGGAGQGTQTNSRAAQSGFEIRVPTTVELAKNLVGHLLLSTGDMDNNVHPANTIRLVDALIKANKRFDFMIFPGQAHGYGPMQGYFQQISAEYFARHLLGDRFNSADLSRRGGGQQ